MRARHSLHPENTKLGLTGGHDIPASHRRVQTEAQVLSCLGGGDNTIVLGEHVSQWINKKKGGEGGQ